MDETFDVAPELGLKIEKCLWKEKQRLIFIVETWTNTECILWKEKEKKNSKKYVKIVSSLIQKSLKKKTYIYQVIS